MSDWNAEQYLKFKKDRTKPSIDLSNKIDIENPKNIIDIGCGPANSTAVLKNKFPNAYVLGVDSSENMISTAKKAIPTLILCCLTQQRILKDLIRNLTLFFQMHAYNGCPTIISLYRI